MGYGLWVMSYELWVMGYGLMPQRTIVEQPITHNP
jgi:hypothetical protein